MQLDNCSQIITLGPKGTFSDEAAQKIRGEGVIVTYTGTFAEALFRVTEEPDSVAVVPIENSVAGTVAQVQDSLVNNKLVICITSNRGLCGAFNSNVIKQCSEIAHSSNEKVSFLSLIHI